MRQYLITYWPAEGEALTEVQGDVPLVRTLVSTERTLREALRLLDRVDKERYVEMSPRLWLWELHRA